jgi:hypothetical protein
MNDDELRKLFDDVAPDGRTAEIHTMIKLELRVTSLEKTVADLQTRVVRLETGH